MWSVRGRPLLDAREIEDYYSEKVCVAAVVLMSVVVILVKMLLLFTDTLTDRL